jgi:hypothetical protein
LEIFSLCDIKSNSINCLKLRVNILLENELKSISLISNFNKEIEKLCQKLDRKNKVEEE